MGHPIQPTHPKSHPENPPGIQKIATQIEGLDDILHGGLPAGRVTLIGGGPGTGKTVFGLEFLYRSALSGHPGIFISFEETAEGIRRNMASLGWDLAALEKSGKIVLIDGQPDPESAVSGQFNLKGLLSIIEGKARQMRADRLVIDALDILTRIYDDPGREQRQILALHNWLTQRGMTAVLTTKNIKETDGSRPYDYLDFMADCVINLDQRVVDQVKTKRIQIIKYRGSDFGSNEYPFLIADTGIYVNAVSDMLLQYELSSQRISSGHPFLDEILGGGYKEATCILISGATGTGKTSMASTFAQSACANGQKLLYFNFEESQASLVYGMLELGIDLRPAIDGASLWVKSVMPESRGIEEHLYDKIKAIKSFQPQHVVVDAISACKRIAGQKAAFDFIMRLIHFCKERGITVFVINQAKNAREDHELSGIGISSIIDTIVTLHYQDVEEETQRFLHVKKSRGSKHSHRYHPFFLTETGIQFDSRTSDSTTPETD